MSQRTDIHSVLVIGSGPVVIGQAGEYDYFGTQACRTLRSMGYEVIVINSNPAAVETDPDIADKTYLEPLNTECVARIVEKERPDALLPNLGGQLGVNLCVDLYKKGILSRNGVEVLGVPVKAIEKTGDRVLFQQAMAGLKLDTVRSEGCYSVEEALDIAKRIGYPLVIRPAGAAGGAGSGLAHDEDELRALCMRGFQTSRIRQVLLEEAIPGWEELELEVMRDKDNHMITVCAIEKADPVDIHRGDSLCVTPLQTVAADVQAALQAQAYKIAEALGVVGCINVQFARNPQDGRLVVRDVHPRASRSSAVAAKAMGFPVAATAAKLAVGLTLAELPSRNFGTLDQYVPSVNHVAVKLPSWSFEKFSDAKDELGTQMRAVGEVLALGMNFKEALQKAVRSLGFQGLGQAEYAAVPKDDLIDKLTVPTSKRYFLIYEALRKGASVEEIQEKTGVKSYFLKQIADIVREDSLISSYKGKTLPADVLAQAKKDGFSDAALADILETSAEQIRAQRLAQDLVPGWEDIAVNGVLTGAYSFTSYHCPVQNRAAAEKTKILVLGSGANRISQSIEFDSNSVHALAALKKLGFATMLVNCNPDAVSTDVAVADQLYFDPVDVETILAICDREKPAGVLALFGGRTALDLAQPLAAAGIQLLGTKVEDILQTEDRMSFRALMNALDIPTSEASVTASPGEAEILADRIGYPVIICPAHGSGSLGREVIHDKAALSAYMAAHKGMTVLIERFLHNALECEADAVSDGTQAFIPAVMEHIELAGVHSGDSACVIPSRHLAAETLATIQDYTTRIATALHVAGLIDVQYAVEDDKVYILEAYLHASRTVPLVSKVCAVDLIDLVVDIMTAPLTGRTSPLASAKAAKLSYYGVKEAVFPFNMLPEVDPALGPVMRSTGEVLGLAKTSGEAFYKAEEGAEAVLPLSGAIIISVSDVDKPYIAAIAQKFTEDDFTIYATDQTYKLLQAAFIPVKRVNKLGEGSPDIEDLIAGGEVKMVINTPSPHKDAAEDDGALRKAAVRAGIPYFTTIVAANACAEGIHRMITHGRSPILSLQEWQRTMADN